MTKYSDEFRANAIRMVEEGHAVCSAARMLGIKEKMLRRWNTNYQAGGFEQLVHKNQSYSPEFKRKVIEYKWEHGLSLPQTIAHFKIPNEGIVVQWEKKYMSAGFAGLLPKKRGRPTKMPKKTESKPRNPTREQELEAEIEQLKMENAYLRKLNALVQARKNQEQSKK